VKELRSIGIQPDILLCRAEQPLPAEERRKIALFTNVPEPAVISAVDSDNVYDIPRLFQSQGLDDIVIKRFGLEVPSADLSEWKAVVDAMAHPDAEVTIGMVGKYMELTESYKSLNEALSHAGIQTRSRVNIEFIDSGQIERVGADCLENLDAVLIPGGFGERGIEGKIQAVRFAREQKIPYLGICLGLQVAIIEIARTLAGLKDANSTEFDAHTPHPVIALVTEWKTTAGGRERRSADSDKGGTMRLGGQLCLLEEESVARSLYGCNRIVERHRHRYEVNNNYLDPLREAGLRISGKSVDEELVEVIELPDHPWFLACQYHPEFTSTPRDGHPLFSGFIAAAVAHQASCR
jgi:CTP synthase